MNTLRILYHVALADFYERVRRYRFLLTLAAIIVLGVLVNNGSIFFDLKAMKITQVTYSFRGELNSAWIGTMTVLVTNVLLGLFGFYLVSDCIARDVRTGVGQIIATTPIRRATYLLGKWISNVLLLFVLVIILAVAAVIMVLLQGEAVLDLVALLMPFLAIALPFMTLIAALAVVFETVPWLRGAAGSAAYFFLWFISFWLSFAVQIDTFFLKDPFGLNVFRTSLMDAARGAFPADSVGGMGVGINYAGLQIKVFNWSGLDWTAGIFGAQWLWAAIGLGLILLSASWFARFDPSLEGLRHLKGKTKETKEGETAVLRTTVPQNAFSNLSPLVSKLAQANPFLGVLLAELRMLLKGPRWWWWVVIGGLNIAFFFIPISMVKGYLLPAAWLWPLAIWSEMGNRERKNNTQQMVFSSARPVLRQMPAAWLAGTLVSALFSAGGAAIFLVKGDLLALAAWAGAVIFVPSLALALGVLSSGSRLFEIIYVIWWFLGPMQKIQAMDFISGMPQIYLLAAAGLLLFSLYWRSRQVRS
jgi:hypothetical protein